MTEWLEQLSMSAVAQPNVKNLLSQSSKNNVIELQINSLSANYALE